MIIQPFEAGPFATNAYIVADEQTKKAVIIDAPPDSADDITEWVWVQGLQVERVLLTHTHWDHTADAAKFTRLFRAPLLVHKADEYRLIAPMDGPLRPPFDIPPMNADGYLEDSMAIPVGSLTLRVIETPGHTEGGICLYEEEQGILFSGDTLFKGSIGRTDFPGGSWETLMASLKALKELPDETVVFPGHGPDTTIGKEKQFNPFLADL
jgi:hydroxyacylglutathione hydrolase